MPKEVLNPSSPPEILPDGITLSGEKNQHEWNTFRIRPHEGSPKQRVLYLHGGAFVWHMLDRHWEFVCDIAKSTRSEIVLPAYPLAPERSATSVPPLIAESLTQAIETTDVLNPGCRRFVKKTDASEGTDVYYHEYVGAGHSHALGKTAASAHARALIDEYIRETSRG